MRELNTYLTFNGNCRDVMTYYNECLGGELKLMTFEGQPMEVSPEYRDKILHATLTIGKAKLMASDTMKGMVVVNGNSISLSIDCESLEEVELYYKNLSHGGRITMPLQDTFRSAKFGMLVDKYGIQWMLNYEKPKNN